jgi:translation initiation factor 3 subunit M
LIIGLSHEQNLQKMRLLTFMQMAENRKEIPFDAILADLQLNADQVEAFVIDG